MTYSPVLSIIVPVYNMEKYLKKCVESILNQVFTEYELILVDDGSTDSSSVICDEFKKADSRIRVIHQQNLGASMARLNGIKESSGKYIGFVDSDDWIEPEMYSSMMEKILDTDADMVISGYIMDDLKNSRIVHPVLNGNISDMFIHNLSIMSAYWNKIIKRNLISQDFFPIERRVDMYEDNFVTFRLFNLAGRVEFLQNAYYHYRQLPDSQSHKCSKNYYEDIIYVIQNLESFSKSKGIYDKYERYFLNEKLNIKLRIVESDLEDRYVLARNVFPECNRAVSIEWRGLISRLKLNSVLLHMEFLIPLLNKIEKSRTNFRGDM